MTTCLLILALALSAPAAGAPAAAPAAVPVAVPAAASAVAQVAEPVFAFVGVNVVPMYNESVLADQTVVVRGDRIAEVGPAASVVVPKDATRIDGKGRWLMPGLADMHVHTWTTDDFPLFLANGVTTVRNMFGSAMQLDWRNSIASNQIVGPTIITAGPIIDGDPPVWPGSTVLTDPAQAEQVVLDQKAAGYDFLKVYAGLKPDVYDALVAAATQHGMRCMGHVPDAVGIEHVLASGQASIEHLDGFAAAAQAKDSPFAGKTDSRLMMRSWQHLDEARLTELAQRCAKSGTWNCPTLVVLEKWLKADARAAQLKRPEMKYVSPLLIASWSPPDCYLGRLPDEVLDDVVAGDAERKRLVGLLHKAGGRLLAGTDMGNPFVVPGYALHEELANLVAAGLSPYEALRAATSGAAEFMKATGEWGVVSVGRRADLLLLDANPLKDVGNAAKRVGVMVRGRWFDAAALQARLDELVKQYAGGGATDEAPSTR